MLKRSNHLQVKTRQELANDYGFSTRTLSRRLKRFGISIGRGLLSPKEILEVYQALGIPRSDRRME